MSHLIKFSVIFSLCSLGIINLQAQTATTPPKDRLFGIVLLQASSEGVDESGRLTADARKVLDDIRQLLPYKAFQYLDGILVRVAGNGRFELKGENGAIYEGIIDFRTGAEPDTLQINRFRLWRQSREVPLPQSRRARTDPPVAPVAKKDLIDTGFSIRLGETLVVGSSQVGEGDQAVLVLLSVAANP